MISSGSGYGSNYAQFSSSHTSQHGVMLRQKSVGKSKFMQLTFSVQFTFFDRSFHLSLSLPPCFRSN